MKTKEKMMVFAYGIYLEEEKDLEFSTRNSYKQKASKYYKGRTEEKPSHLEEAEKTIGFKN